MENQPSAQPAHQAELVAWYLTFRVPLHFAAIPETDVSALSTQLDRVGGAALWSELRTSRD